MAAQGPPLQAPIIVAATPSRAREARAFPVLVRGKRARFRFTATTEQIPFLWWQIAATTVFYPSSIQAIARAMRPLGSLKWPPGFISNLVLMPASR